MIDDLTRPTAHELADRLRSGETTSREITAAHLARAHATDHGLHAWLTIDDERALAEADAADARLAAARTDGAAAVTALHPLLGIPVAIGVTAALDLMVGGMLGGDPLPLRFSPVAGAAWLAVVLAGAVLATLPPARRAARLTVREALAYL